MRYILTALVAAALAAPAHSDDIILQNGDTIRDVTVTSETLAEVKYTEGGQSKSVSPGTKVKAILRDEIPDGLDNGLGFLNAGRHQKAIEEFRAVASSGAGWEVEYAYHGLGQAWLKVGMRRNDKAAIGKAVEALDKLVATNSATRFLIEANLLKGFCQRVVKDYSAAIAAYDAAKAAAAANGIGDGWPERAQCGIGWSHLEAGRAKEAQAAFQGATNSSVPEVKRLALSGWSEATAMSGGSSDVTMKMEGLRTGADIATLGVVNNGLGVVAFMKKDYGTARLHFVKTVSIHFADPNAHARALYYAGRCYEALDEQSYASVYWRELRNRYPLTTWALRAR